MSQPDQLLKHFEIARRDLLELSTANRMLSTPREQHHGASIEIVDESSAEVFRMLVREGSAMRFEEGVIDDSAAPAEELKPSPEDSLSNDQAEQVKPAVKRRTKKKAAEIQAALESPALGDPARSSASAGKSDGTGRIPAVSTTDVFCTRSWLRKNWIVD